MSAELTRQKIEGRERRSLQPSLALFRAGVELRPHDGVKIGTLTDKTGQIFGSVFELKEPLQADEPGGAHVGEPLRIRPSAGSNAPELASQIVGDCAKGIFVSLVGFVRVAPIFFSCDRTVRRAP
jgi:hypothetical protein